MGGGRLRGNGEGGVFVVVVFVCFVFSPGYPLFSFSTTIISFLLSSFFFFSLLLISHSRTG